MKPVRRLITLAAIGALGATTWGVGTSLVKDVQFAKAEAAVNDARSTLSTSNDMSNVYKQVNHAMENSVVHITVTKTVRAQPGLSLPDLFRGAPDDGNDDSPAVPEPRRRRALPQMPQQAPQDDEPIEQKEVATGSGAIMDAGNGEGFIITNNHVVADATSVTVTLNDGRRIENATIVATDPKSDIAVVKIKADRIIAAKWGDSDTLEKGDIIVAFGSPLGFVGSMSHGIVSALNRDHVNILRSAAGSFAYENFIQVDAAINPGNSGGPLVNTHGEVVGINTAIASNTGTFSGIGFAIPSNQAKAVYESLKTNGKVVRGYMGVGISEMQSEDPKVQAIADATNFKGENGILVFQVQAGSPALNVLQLADVITELNGQKLKNLTEFRTKIAAMAPGTTVKLTVWRDEKFQQVDVTLGTQPEGQMAAVTGKPERAQPQQQQQMGTLGLSVATPTAADLTAAGLSGDVQGAIVKQVRPNSLAALMGIKPGELITRIGNTPVTNADEAKAAFAKANLDNGLRMDLISKEGQRLVMVPKKADR